MTMQAALLTFSIFFSLFQKMGGHLEAFCEGIVEIDEMCGIAGKRKREMRENADEEIEEDEEEAQLRANLAIAAKLFLR